MLRNGGIDADINFGTDTCHKADGKAGLYMFGGAILKDPYTALELFHVYSTFRNH